MLRISKLTDYSIVVMTYLAHHPGQDHAAKTIATHTHISVPTVSKILKLLTRSGLLIAQRGVKGGYSLAQTAQQISLAQIIQAMEGNMLAFTECCHNEGLCAVEDQCTVRSNWRLLSEIIRETLSSISLAQMAYPLTTATISQAISKQFPKYLNSALVPAKI